MRQPIKGGGKVKRRNPRRRNSVKKHQEYGTSKLEQDFAREFLDRNHIDYIYQYKAESIGRYYDFMVVLPYNGQMLVKEEKDGLMSVVQNGQVYRIVFAIEVDGSWFHGDSRIVEEDKMNRMQRRNRVVDEVKDKWCHLNCIPIVRFWELDIKNNPNMVKKVVMEYVGKGEKDIKKKENFSKPHGTVVRK